YLYQILSPYAKYHPLTVIPMCLKGTCRLGFNEDLAEAIGLGHDLGHAPFGHHGEKVLNEISQKELKKPFQHEIHGLRVVDMLAERDRTKEIGLNLTYEVRDGIISHCGEDFSRTIEPVKFEDKPALETVNDRKFVKEPTTYEGCIVRLVDRIAYVGRDIEDAIVGEIIEETDIPEEVTNILGMNNGEILNTLLSDLIEYSKNNPEVIGLSEEVSASFDILKDYNYEKIYKHEKVEKYKEHATRAIKTLFGRLLDDITISERFALGDKLPKEVKVYDVFKDFCTKVQYDDQEPNEQIVIDFISGMTDHYVIKCLDAIFVPKYTI
ncbi:MAG: HD domain-containing protein, partial [Oligoflexia bacterium]|nr:HD domain-containing protein [Oligoflexia bacterium]